MVNIKNRFVAKAKRLGLFIAATFLLTMTASPLADTALAFSGSGLGTEESPFLITSCTQLQEMADDLDAYYELRANIDCSATATWNAGKGFDPVGDNSTPFTGELDGKGYTISDLIILRADDDSGVSGDDESYVGLFGYTSGATIDNLHIRNSKIKGYQYVGGVTGYTASTTITNSTVNTTTPDNDCNGSTDRCVWARYGYYGGGIAGYADNNSTISNVSTGGPVRGSGNYIGGLVGSFVGVGSSLTNATSSSDTDGGESIGGAIGTLGGGTVTNVHVSGDASAALDEAAGKFGRNVGGFVGIAFSFGGGDPTITESSATGNVSSDVGSAGGFVGSVSAEVEITDSYASGDVSLPSGSDVGGFVGRMSSNSSLSRVYSTGSVEGGSASNQVSGLIGNLTNSGANTVVEDSFTTSPITQSGGIGGLVGYKNATNLDVEDSYYDQARTTKIFVMNSLTVALVTASLALPPVSL